MKKAISAATSAALLASLLATAVAPSAFAAVTVAGVGTIAQGATSATAATFTFTENSAAALTTTGTMTVTIAAKASLPGTVTFVGTPTLTGNTASLGATITSTATSFTIKITDFDNLNVETLVVGGLKIKAATTATPGAMTATLSGDATVYGAFTGATVTAQGTLQSISGTTVTVNTTSDCGFASGTANTATFGSQTGVIINGGVTGTAPGIQALGLSAALTGSHVIGEAVSQTVTNCGSTTLTSPGTVGAAITFDTPTTPTVFPGENFANAANLTLHSTDASTGTGFIDAGAVITATIATAGVTFSGAPLATAYDNTTGTNSISLPDNRAPGFLFVATPTNSNPAVGTLSSDKKSVTWTVKSASTSLVRLVISGIQYNVASTVTGGSTVDVGVTVSGALVQPATRSNAVVARPVTATSTTTTVYIGETNQAAGDISIVENAAATFTDGTGSFNTFQVCLTTSEHFSSAPSATVSVGDLQLRSANAAVAAGTAVVGTPFTTNTGNSNCYYWTVWAASTAASTIKISPIKVDVPAGLSVGNTNAEVSFGSLIDAPGSASAIILTIANRLFRNQVVVTALSQPFIPVGSNGSAVGDIQVQETANGQLKAGEEICVEILPNQNVNILYDAFLKGLNTADRPIATASNGVVVGAVTLGAPGQLCTSNIRATGIGSTLVLSFSVNVSQQSLTGNGKVVFSNIKYATVNDAVQGPVQVNVYGLGGSPTSVQFQSLISNAQIGTAPVAAAVTTSGSALGATKTGPFTIGTKVAKLGKYVTWKFSGGSALVGKTVQIWVATKNSAGKWSAFKPLTARRVDASGNAYFWWKTSSKAWISVRGGYLTSLSVATQARWL